MHISVGGKLTMYNNDPALGAIDLMNSMLKSIGDDRKIRNTGYNTYKIVDQLNLK